VGSDQQAIQDVHAAWIASVNAGDLDRLLALMTDDAVFLRPQPAPARDAHASTPR